MEPFKFDIIHSVMDDKGYPFLTSGVYNVNLISVRVEDRREAYPDQLHVIYRSDTDSRFKQHIFDINTCTGKHWVFNPLNIFGTEILVPGHYRNAYSLSVDDCLHQQREMLFVRDTWPGLNYNLPLYEGLENKMLNSRQLKTGADLICAHSLKKALGINYYRGGLQVLKKVTDLDIILELCDRHIGCGNGRFLNYTLLEEKDFA